MIELVEAERNAQLAAELGCLDSVAAVVEWLQVPENGRPLWGGGEDGGWLVDVVNRRPVEWRAELAGALAEQVEANYNLKFAFLEHLVLDTGCPVPTSDAFLTAWLGDRRHYYRERPPHLKGGVQGAGFRERLLADPWTAQLLPLALVRLGIELPLEELVALSSTEVGLFDRDQLVDRCFMAVSGKLPWGAGLLASLALTPADHARVAGHRAELLDRCVERLLQDGTRPELVPWFDVLRALAPPLAEHAAFARDYLVLLDGSPAVAGYAQEILVELDEAGLVEPELVVEASERVLLRPEKKLVRAQLSWLDKAAKQDPGRFVVAAATAFGNRDSALQERALAVVARHFKAAGEPDLRAAAERLSPGLSVRAAELLGMTSDLGTPHVADVLPAVPEPRPVPGPIVTVTEVAQEVAAVLAGDEDVVAFERALDGLVRHAHLDRAALADALKPATRKEPRWRHDHMAAELYDLARAVRDEPPRVPDFMTHRSVTLAGEALLARVREATDAVKSGALPFLLAIPTLATGALDAAVLVERLAAYEELGVTPGPVDLAQALLRVTADEQVLAAAEELRSDAGKRVAQWLRTGGIPHQDSKPEGWDPYTDRRWKMLRPASPGVSTDLPKPFADLVGPYRSNGQIQQSPKAFWIAQLPHHRDLLAAREYFAPATNDRSAAALPFLAESGGPAGYAVHMALAWGMAGGQSAVDAVLVVAARGQLDATLLGQQLAMLVHEGAVKANHLAELMRLMVDMGAPGVVWSVFEGALPVLLHDKPARGAGELLAVAVECASRCGASGEIAQVTAVAGGKGSSLIVKNARALQEVLLR